MDVSVFTFVFIRRVSMNIQKIVGAVCGLWLLSLPVYAQSPRILRHIEDTVACNRWVEQRLSQMTLKQKIGQLFIHTIAPYTHKRNMEELESAVKEYGVGGLLFSGGETAKQVQLTVRAQEMAEIPLLITFDGEWGLAMRLKGTPEFPKNRVLGCIRNDTLLYQYGREVARQLREIGVQVNFAPVADVDNNPGNPVINTRSFGGDAREVARKVIAYSRGLEDGGVMAVCKHFPGHGDTETDSHVSLPVLHFGRERLDSVELYPFKEAVLAGVSGMMVGHLKVPELDRKPASISSEVIMKTLKDELHFSGLVFTDALEMESISKSSDNLCADALAAGNDLLLVPRNLKRSMAGVLKAVKEGRLTEEYITEKCRKVLVYKYALGLDNVPALNADGLPDRLFTTETAALMKELGQAAVTVVKDSLDMLPLDLALSGNVLLSISPSLTESYPFYKELHKSVSLSWIHADTDSLERIRERIRPAQQVIVALHQQDMKGFESLITELAAEKPLVLVCFTSLDALKKLSPVADKAAAVVLAHTDNADLQEYVAGVLTGKELVDGRLSVDVQGIAKIGTGITLDPDFPRSYKPEDFGMDSNVLAGIDGIVQEGIREHAFPGCHVLVLKEGYPVYNKCFGTRTYDSESEVRENDIYDLASVSKAAGTLLAVMKLYDDGKFGLTDKVSRYLPALRGTNKENVTIQDLLFHESGLPASIPFYLEAIDLKSVKGGLFKKKPDKNHTLQIEENLYVNPDFSYKPAWVSKDSTDVYSLRLADNLYLNPKFQDVVMDEIIKAPVKGHSYRYSCINFMLLKEMVEAVSGTPMDVFLDSVFYKPMGLMNTAYQPLKHFDRNRIVPTLKYDFLRKGELKGDVHDEAAAFMGGVSGNAGLFSTAHDVSVIFQMLLDRGVCGDVRYLSRATCDLFLTLKSKESRRGLGFDKPDVEDVDDSPCAVEAPGSVFGHTGYTGTAVWVDPDHDIVFVFLSNRTYPQAFDHKNLMKLNIRPRIQQAIYQSLTR